MTGKKTRQLPIKYNGEKITVITEAIALRVRNNDSFIDQTYFVTMPVSSHFELMFGQYIFCCMEAATIYLIPSLLLLTTISLFSH